MASPVSFEHWVQSRLTSHGFATGGIDGDIGPVSRAAIRAFQRSRNLRVTGQADEPTVDALRATSSQGVKAPIDRDVDARPSSIRPMGPWPRQRDVMSFYGPVGQNTVLVPVPWRMRLAWDKRRTIRRMSLHEKVADSAGRAFERCKREYGEDGLRHIGAALFGGSLNVRRMRGGSRYSMHSWAIAIDFDPERNGLRTKQPQARLSRADCEPWWAAWEAEGWVSLGRERDFDWMHVQAARL